MKAFIIKIASFFGIMLLLYGVAYFIAHRATAESNDYMLAMQDKHQRIEQIKQPKLIISGGSNTVFGIDSKTLQDSLGVPVVNLGLHAGLGIQFILNELKSVIKNGDVVLLSFEYFIGDGDYNLKKFTSKLYPKANAYYNKDFMNELSASIYTTRQGVVGFFKAQKNKDKTSVYSRNGFNEYGDLVSYLNQTAPNVLKNRNELQFKKWEGITWLNAFNQFAKAKNVTVYLMFPSYPKTEYERNKNVIQQLYIDLNNNLNFNLLGTPQDFVFDDKFFFDTVYHLNGEGRILKTKRLLDLIKNKIELQQRLSEMSKYKNQSI